MAAGSNLIFVISQPRSGSTLLQRILGMHPDIHTVSEPWIALHPLFALRREGVSTYYSHALAHDATTAFLAAVPDGDAIYLDGVRQMLDRLYQAALAPSGKRLFLDKTPRYYFIVPELRRVFPEARFVFLLRNPLAVLSSMLDAWVGPPFFAGRYALRFDVLHDLLTAPEALVSAVKSMGARDALVRYEALATAPVETVAALCATLGLGFDPQMVNYGDGGGNCQAWAFGDQGTIYAEQRPVATPVERWRTSLRAVPERHALARAYLVALGPAMIRRLGYDPDVLASALDDGARTAVAPLLEAAILTPNSGESCDYLAQSAVFEALLRRFAATADATAAEARE